jgi:alanyl-tRNA synthetase
MKENFWEMGDTGPCGPCSEIHYDRIGGRDAAALVNLDDPDVLEIWNLVFMQFNREQDRSLIRLPKPCVDTGMGLERVTSVLLHKRSNYDIDLFQGLFEAIREVVGESLRPYAGKVGAADTDLVDMAYRVVADHIRTFTFSITDGALPSAEGRGYVLRRILRRAVRYGADILKAPAGFFHKLVPAVVRLMGDAFPELRGKPAEVMAVLKEEEAQFTRTLSNGLKEFSRRTAKLARGDALAAEDVHTLYTSFGFPVDLTELMAAEKGFTVDLPAFEALLEKTKEESRGASAFGAGGALLLEAAQIDELQKLAVANTDDEPKYSWRAADGTGDALDATVMAIYAGQKEGFVQAAAAGATVGVVLERTSFYAEQGGQVYDVGTLSRAAGGAPCFAVSDCQKFGGYVLHIGTPAAEGLKVGDKVRVAVDYARRAPIAKNHTSTHVLNLALREELGDGVDQRGSLVNEERARFDFAFNRALTDAEVAAVEAGVQRRVAAGLAVHAQVVPLKTATTVKSLRCVFGEAYPDPVRVLSVGTARRSAGETALRRRAGVGTRDARLGSPVAQSAHSLARARAPAPAFAPPFLRQACRSTTCSARPTRPSGPSSPSSSAAART